MVASSPIARCRRPPIFALAYISPARSSKRRISVIVESHSRATAASGSSFSAICPEATAWTERQTPDAGAVPATALRALPGSLGAGVGKGFSLMFSRPPAETVCFVTDRTPTRASSRWTPRFGARTNGDGHDTETDGDHRGSGTGRARRGGGARPATDPGRRARTGRRGRRVVVYALRPAATELEPVVLAAAGRALRPRGRRVPLARRDGSLPRPLRPPLRDRRAAAHERRADRPRG